MSARRLQRLFWPVVLVAIVLAIAGVGSVQAQEQPNDPPKRISDEETVPGQVIVKFEEGATRAQVSDVRRDEGLQKKENLDLINAEVDRVRGNPSSRPSATSNAARTSNTPSRTSYLIRMLSPTWL